MTKSKECFVIQFNEETPDQWEDYGEYDTLEEAITEAKAIIRSSDPGDIASFTVHKKTVAYQSEWHFNLNEQTWHKVG